jgi:shikimate kinase
MNMATEDERNLYLTGFMGCGKTTVGRLVAETVSRPFLDTDELIVSRTGMIIPEIFREKGEACFREQERAVIQEVSERKQTIVSLGGGAVLDPENWERITRSGTTVFLSFPADILASRLRGHLDRPLLDGLKDSEQEERIRTLLKERTPAYSRADLTLHLNRSIPPERIAAMIVSFAGLGGRNEKK